MHLPIRVVGRSQPVEVPFRLFTSFKFACFIPGHGVQEFVADLSSRDVLKTRVWGIAARDLSTPNDASNWDLAVSAAEAILAAVLRRLGVVETHGERHVAHGPDALTWIAIAHDAERRASNACANALTHLMPVWRDRTEPAPRVHVAADILDSYYQQVQDEVLGEWEDKAQREANEDLTSRTAGGNSEVTQ